MKSEKKREIYSLFLVPLAVFIVLVDWCLQYWNKFNSFGVENSGISFGLGNGFGEYFRFLIPIVVFVFFVWIWRKKQNGNVFLLILLIGGLGNVIPRVVWGHVWDYIHVPFVDLWINLSDVLISTAALSYILVDNDRDSNCL